MSAGIGPAQAKRLRAEDSHIYMVVGKMGSSHAHLSYKSSLQSGSAPGLVGLACRLLENPAVVIDRHRSPAAKRETLRAALPENTVRH